MKLKRLFGILTIFLIIMCGVSANIKNTVVTVEDSGYTNRGNVGRMSEGTVVEYRYQASGETIEGYDFLFATYGEELSKGTVYMDVYDADSNETIAKGSIRVNAIEDNGLTFIDTKRVNLGSRDIRVILYCEGFETDKRITLWLGENNENEDGETFVNGVPLQNNLLIFSHKVTKEAPYTWDFILLTSICFVLYCSIPGRSKENQLGGSDELEEKITET